MADQRETTRGELLALLHENRRLRVKAIREGLLGSLPELDEAKADIEAALRIHHDRGELW